MMSLKYEELGPIPNTDVEAAFSSGDPNLIARTLIALGLHEANWRLVQNYALRFLSHESEVVVSASILALAHSARVNGSIDKENVFPALHALITDPRYVGKVQDALDDIEVYARNS